jgi:site-specific DNA recombinase
MTSTHLHDTKPGLNAIHRAVLYLRLSDLREVDLNEDGRGKTFDARAAMLRDYAERNGATVVEVVVENDLVISKSGRTRNASAFKRRRVLQPDGSVKLRVVRPGFSKILSWLESGYVNMLIAEDLDRVMRDNRDNEDLIDVVEAARANVRSLSGSLQLTNGGTDDEITQARLLCTFANKFSRDARRRAKNARHRKAVAGEFAGGPRPYGFEPDGITPRVSEYKEVQGWADSLLAGVPLGSIAQSLREREVPSVSGVPWTPEMVRSILKRPRNKGVLLHRGEEFGKAPWEPILEVDIYEAVLARLSSPTVQWVDRWGKKRSAPRRTNEGTCTRWLGTGIYRCVCDSGMEVHLRTGHAGRKPVYRCKQGGPGKHVTRDAVALDDYIQHVAVARLARPDAMDLITAPSSGVDVAALRAEAATLRSKLDDFAVAYADEVIDRAQLAAGTKRVNAKLATIDELLMSATLVSPLKPLIAAADVTSAWRDLSLGERRAIVRTLLEVRVLPSRRGKGFDPKTVQVTIAA